MKYTDLRKHCVHNHDLRRNTGMNHQQLEAWHAKDHTAGGPHNNHSHSAKEEEDR